MFRDLTFLSLATAAAIITIAAAAGSANAQISDRPFSFRNSPGGLGMSPGGRQAIMNEQILGETPDNLLRWSDGRLLDVTRGSGNSAIVSRVEDGGFIPGYHGTDFRSGNLNMQAGVFNSFFSPVYHYDSYYTAGNFQTGSVISAWVANVASGGMPFSYYDNGNTVSSWTSFVNNLNGY